MPLDRLAIEELVLEDLGISTGTGVLPQTFVIDEFSFEDRDEIESFPDNGPVLNAVFDVPNGYKEQYAVRWRLRGHQRQTRHTDSIDSPSGPTGNRVDFTGITIVEIEPDQPPQFMRYIDWLSAYSQMGLVEMRRPSITRYTDGGEYRIAPVIGFVGPDDMATIGQADDLPRLPVENDLPIY